MTDPAVRSEGDRSRRPDQPNPSRRAQGRSSKAAGLRVSGLCLTEPSTLAISVRSGKHAPGQLRNARRVSNLLVAEQPLRREHSRSGSLQTDGPYSRAQKLVSTSTMSCTGSSFISVRSTTISLRPEAESAASMYSEPKRARRSRCSTTTVWTDASASSRMTFARRPFRPGFAVIGHTWWSAM
jgi:hypothetical protein